MRPNRSFIKNMAIALNDARNMGVHVKEIEIAVPFIRTQMRILFQLVSGSPGFDVNQVCEALETEDWVALDKLWHPSPSHYFTFSSKYPVEINMGALCQAISRIVHRNP